MPPHRRPPVALVSALVLALGVLAGCPAEQLGIELPPPGVESINPDDLLRDTRGVLALDGESFLERRFTRMNLDVSTGTGWVCGEREGKGGAARTLVAAWPKDVDHAVSVAALISMAKAWDTLDGPSGPRRVCVAELDADVPILGTRWTVGPLAPGILLDRSVDPSFVDGGWAQPTVRSGTPDPTRVLGAIDYRQTGHVVRGVFARVE